MRSSTSPIWTIRSKPAAYRIAPVAFTVVAPIGLYSRKVKSVADLPQGARIGIPNDPSNGGRGLNLLAAQGVIALRPGAGITPTVLDITGNPKHVQIVELDAGIIGRSLDDLGRSNRQYRLGAQSRSWASTPALLAKRSTTIPTATSLRVQAGHENDPRILTLVEAYHSDAVRQFILKHYQGRQLPAW